MAERTFEWDPEKAQENERKHGVSFEEASSVFLSPLSKMHGDPDHSDDESRAIMVGHSSRSRLFLVAFAYREDRIRIISARPTTRRERREYEEAR